MKPTKKKPVKRKKWTGRSLYEAGRVIRLKQHGNLYTTDTWESYHASGKKIYSLLAKHINEN